MSKYIYSSDMNTQSVLALNIIEQSGIGTSQMVQDKVVLNLDYDLTYKQYLIKFFVCYNDNYKAFLDAKTADEQKQIVKNALDILAIMRSFMIIDQENLTQDEYYLLNEDLFSKLQSIFHKYDLFCEFKEGKIFAYCPLEYVVRVATDILMSKDEDLKNLWMKYVYLERYVYHDVYQKVCL